MRFYIEKMVLWLKDNTIRTLEFQDDKINVITGNSKTGKTAVLEIIDYCLCGSKDTVVISYEHIGQNVLWYGICFHINNKVYTIARGAISETGKFSSEYYFSQMGEIPEIPCVKMEESEIKTILENEFSIDDELTVSYGGRSVKKNTRISFRYFLMYNTLSKDIVDNGKHFFDKLDIERYRDVWPQVFDLVFGVIDSESITLKKNIDALRQEIFTLENNIKKYLRKKEQEGLKLDLLIKHAKEGLLINESLEKKEALLQIKKIVNDDISNFANEFSIQQQYVKLVEDKEKYKLQLVKLQRFNKSYNMYKNSLKEDLDSIMPVAYIRERYGIRISGEYKQFLDILADDLRIVKKSIADKRPFEFDVKRKINELNKFIREIDSKLAKTAQVNYSAIPTAQKLVSLGELKAEYKSIDFGKNEIDLQKVLNEKYKELDKLEEQYSIIDERRNLVVDTLNEFIQYYIDISKDALDEYGNYCAWFEYKKERLTLKKNKSASIAQISSSSDHLFMHLCLFAGIHNMILDGTINFVPSFLIIDQPSRPYFNNSEYDYKESEKALSKKDDWFKVKNIFSLWDNFFETILEHEKHFQIILLEHVEEEAWSDCIHVHLVEIFDGKENALIPLNLE